MVGASLEYSYWDTVVKRYHVLRRDSGRAVGRGQYWEKQDLVKVALVRVLYRQRC